MNLQQVRALQLPAVLQRVGQWTGGVGVAWWFWWVLLEKGALSSLTEDPNLTEILLGLPLILILPAIYYATVFLFLRVLYWIIFSPQQEVREQETPMDPEDPSGS